MLPEKANLRSEMRARLKRLAPEMRARWSRAICEFIARQSAYSQAHTVAVFDAMPSEPRVETLWEIAPRRFVYPRVEGAELLLLEVPDLDALHPSTTGARFREPAASAERIIDPVALDLVLVPGLAFARDGRRLGRGGGFYDRLLARLPAQCAKLGVCFASQLVEELPCEAHDMRVDAVITEESGGTCI